MLLDTTTAHGNYLREQQRNRNDNSLIFAAISHALATRVFLLRTAEITHNGKGLAATLSPDTIKVRIQACVSELHQAICAVPLYTNAVTILLWPLFVLGCESEENSVKRRKVETTLEGMRQKENINTSRSAWSA